MPDNHMQSKKVMATSPTSFQANGCWSKASSACFLFLNAKKELLPSLFLSLLMGSCPSCLGDFSSDQILSLDLRPYNATTTNPIICPFDALCVQYVFEL